MIAEAPVSASTSATLPANVAEWMTAEEAVEYLTEAVGRKVEYSRLTSMLAQGEPVLDAEGKKIGSKGHPAVRPMKENGLKEQGHWRFRLRDVRYAAEHWPRPVGTGPRPLRGLRGRHWPRPEGSEEQPAVRKRRSDWGTGSWQEKRREAARLAAERRKGEQQHGDDQPADT